MDDELSLLVKPVSADCNMRCAYCFYQRPGDPYRSEERHIMDDGTLKTMIAGYMQSAGRGASFGWQGGEPSWRASISSGGSSPARSATASRRSW